MKTAGVRKLSAGKSTVCMHETVDARTEQAHTHLAVKVETWVIAISRQTRGALKCRANDNCGAWAVFEKQRRLSFSTWRVVPTHTLPSRHSNHQKSTPRAKGEAAAGGTATAAGKHTQQPSVATLVLSGTARSSTLQQLRTLTQRHTTRRAEFGRKAHT